jgi:hypothetical protein
MPMKTFLASMLALLALPSVAGCGTLNGSGALPLARSHGMSRPHSGSLGPVLKTSDGGQIFGFDIDQNGNDGVLASAGPLDISIQTFDETTGKITKTFGRKTGSKITKGDDYVVDGIFTGDVALVDFQKAGIPGQKPAHDMYRVIDPVTADDFTGKWSAKIKLFNVLQWAINQSTTTSVLFGYPRSGSDATKLIVTDVASNTVSKVIALDQNQFSLPASPQLAEDTVNNLAVTAASPSGGAAGGPPPIIATVDLKTGDVTEFDGVSCPGLAGCGYANGIGYDSSTGIACTTTEIDGGVEFYNVAQQTGTHEFMPNGGGQLYAGAYVASDPVNQLFLIAQPFSSTSTGSSVQVYDETGNFVESIDGLDFTDAGDLALPIRIAINPNKRIGWVNGPKVSDLQEFSY